MEFEVLSTWSDYEWSKIKNIIIEIHLLNKKMEMERDEIFLKIKNIFPKIEIIEP